MKTKKSTPSESPGSSGHKPFRPWGFLSADWFKRWVIPSSVVGGLAMASYLSVRLLDFSEQKVGSSFYQVVFLTHAEDVVNSIGGVGQVLIAILGLVVTVVAIVVQLAAERYTPKLVELFIADRANIAYFVLMVGSTIFSMLLIYSTTGRFLPFWGALTLLVLTTVILSLLIPYFNYVFFFLTPGNIIRIIRGNAKSAMGKVIASDAQKKVDVRRLQTEVANAMEQISDIALSAVSQMDRYVALLSIRSLKDVMVDHLLLKQRMPGRWFVPVREHFQAISTDFLQELYKGRNWVEMKGFMDLELIFKMAIKDMPDAVSAIANNAKIVGLYAIKFRDKQVLADVIQFFNTFLRLAVNERNPKAIYSLFYQYRMLAEEVLRVDEKLSERIAFYFKYYGQIAQAYNIPLILITASFDLAAILKRAYELKVANIEVLIKTFLEVDDNPATRANEFDLRSVRKAQLNFASFLLSQGEETLILRFVDDLRAEPQSRMEAIRKEMMAVKDRKFWEVTDRGVDFFYIDEEQKHFLNAFFVRYIEPHYEQPPLEVRPA